MTMTGPVLSGTDRRFFVLGWPCGQCLINTWGGGLPKPSRLARGSILAAAVVVVTCSTRQSSQLASWQAKKQRWCGGGGGYRDEIHPNGHRRTSGLAVGVVRPAARPRRSLAFKV